MAKYHYLLVGIVIGIAMTSISTSILYSMDLPRINTSTEPISSRKSEQSYFLDSAWNQKNHSRQDTLNNKKKKKRLLQAVFGSTFYPIFTKMQDLGNQRPSLTQSIQKWEQDTLKLAQYILHHTLTLEKMNADAALHMILEEPGPPSVTVKWATYGPLPGVPQNHRTPSTVDVKWIMERFIFDSLLRIPANYSVLNLFGSQPPGSDEYFPFSLNVGAILENGTHVNVSVPVYNATVQKDLIVSSALPTQEIRMKVDSILTDACLNCTAGKIGLELGGPTGRFFGKFYEAAYRTDLVNFAEQTLWGTFKNGSRFNYTDKPDGPWGLMHITDGATLHGIADDVYDFVLGSHYLEHLINPLQSMASMARVLKPGGCMILILPRKEACFDEYRGQSPIEDILFRYLHQIDPTDMRYSNIDHWMFGNNLVRDYGGNFHQMLARSVREPENRAMHIHVYDFNLLESLGKLFSFEVELQTLGGALHQWIIFKKPL